jgi:hypothetical protein
MNSVEKNYSSTKNEALPMVYALKKFIHYLLGNIFIIDHQVDSSINKSTMY